MLKNSKIVAILAKIFFNIASFGTFRIINKKFKILEFSYFSVFPFLLSFWQNRLSVSEKFLSKKKPDTPAWNI